MRYLAPDSVDGAVSALAGARGHARVLAGGTDLLVQLRSGRIAPTLVVDIKRIGETRRIARDGNGFRIGAAVSGAELGENAELARQWPGVVEAMALIGSTQIQGRASLGGNLCNASPAADSVPALIAAGAGCTIAGPTGRRELAVERVCTGPGQTSLEDDEFIVSFSLPERAPRSADAYLRFIPRTEMDIAVVGVGVRLRLDDKDRCADARIALGAVAPTAILVEPAAQALLGTPVDDEGIGAMTAAVRAACEPIDDKRGTIAFRTRVAGVLAGRAARIALARARAL